MDLDPWLPRAAALRPDHPALIDVDGDETSYADLHVQARDAAAALQAKGIERGDRVALALPAGAPFLAALHATLMLGAAIVPIDLRLAPGEQAQRSRGAKVTVTSRSAAPASRTPRPSTASTPPPRRRSSTPPARPPSRSRSRLTIGNWTWNALGSALALGVDPCDRWLCALPLSHVGGLAILIRSAIYGTTVVLHERFDTEAALTAIERDEVTLVSLVPTTLERLLDIGLKAPNPLRVALIGGGPLAPVLAAQAQEAGIPVAQTYGMTEACSQVATSLPGEPETAGRPLVGQRVQIAPDGEILVAGPNVAPDTVAADGWLHTGDRGTLDAHGRLAITGRKADTIVSGGRTSRRPRSRRRCWSTRPSLTPASTAVPTPNGGRRSSRPSCCTTAATRRRRSCAPTWPPSSPASRCRRRSRSPRRFRARHPASCCVASCRTTPPPDDARPRHDR